jgi:hypothetical protein
MPSCAQLKVHAAGAAGNQAGCRDHSSRGRSAAGGDFLRAIGQSLDEQLLVVDIGFGGSTGWVWIDLSEFPGRSPKVNHLRLHRGFQVEPAGAQVVVSSGAAGVATLKISFRMSG